MACLFMDVMEHLKLKRIRADIFSRFRIEMELSEAGETDDLERL